MRSKLRVGASVVIGGRGDHEGAFWEYRGDGIGEVQTWGEAPSVGCGRWMSCVGCWVGGMDGGCWVGCVGCDWVSCVCGCWVGGMGGWVGGVPREVSGVDGVGGVGGMRGGELIELRGLGTSGVVKRGH